MSSSRIVLICAGALLLSCAAPAAQAREKGYYDPYVRGADGRKYPRMNIPGNDTVITREMLDDQQATTLGQALRNASGVYVRR
jgi:outer membrane receptor protein involved in Fe transport